MVRMIDLLQQGQRFRAFPHRVESSVFDLPALAKVCNLLEDGHNRP
jgi:hypothetical protein